jgi:NADH-quinone oxidoreductase subunit N
MNPSNALQILLPEITLIVAGVVVLFAGLFMQRTRYNATPLMAIVGLLVAFVVATWNMENVVSSAYGVTHDSFLHYVRMITVMVGIVIILVNWHVPADAERPEFFALMLFSLSGISLTAAANDLLLLFLALELVSVPTYILIGLSRSTLSVKEATCKYFFLGAFAAAITLYGFSFIYGATGTTSLQSAALTGATLGSGILGIGMLLAVLGLAFKIAAVPLHFYVADVYQGAASPVSGMLGFVPKLAGFVALTRLFSAINWDFDATGLFWPMWMLAVATMTVGNSLALMQRNNVKRVLAYSSVAHSGYMLIALLVGPGLAGKDAGPLSSGVSAMLFYMLIYGVTNLGAFSVLAMLRRPGDGESIETFDELGAAVRDQRWPAMALAICALGLMGLPPTAGLMGKVYVFSAALTTPAGSAHYDAMMWLVVIGVLNAAVGAAYYLRIFATCIIGDRSEESTTAPPVACRALSGGMALCAVFVLAAFLRPGPFIRLAQYGGIAIRRTVTFVKDASAPSVASTPPSRSRPAGDVAAPMPIQ